MKDIQKAVLFIILSTSCFAIMNGLVKYLSGFSAYQLVFFRSAGTLIITSSLLVYRRIPMLGNKRLLLLVRGAGGAISLLLFFTSLKYLPVGTAVTLRYLSPIFAAIFAVIWLKETIKPIQWLFFLLAFLGVFVLKGFDSDLSMVGLSMILGSALFMGFVFVVIVKIGKQDHPLVIVNYFMLVGTLVGGLLCFTDWRNPVGMEWALLVILGIVGFISQLFMTKAFQIASTNQIAPLQYLEVIFTVMIGAFWFMEVYTLWSLLGIILVVIGLTMNILYKGRKARP